MGTRLHGCAHQSHLQIDRSVLVDDPRDKANKYISPSSDFLRISPSSPTVSTHETCDGKPLHVDPQLNDSAPKAKPCIGLKTSTDSDTMNSSTFSPQSTPTPMAKAFAPTASAVGTLTTYQRRRLHGTIPSGPPI
ncbi:MAG: hypothetical protein CM15mP49_25110 [Actinomycetota bacterium]|nr:MAG: hypothetical protein CM15mP49_25110 [Actinomycetota bacterium]